MNEPIRSATPDDEWTFDRTALRMALGLDSEPRPTQIRSISSGLFGPDDKPIVKDGGRQGE